MARNKKKQSEKKIQSGTQPQQSAPKEVQSDSKEVQQDSNKAQPDTNNPQSEANKTEGNPPNGNNNTTNNNSIFDRFNTITNQAEEGYSFAFNCYRRYMELFNFEDRKVLAKFEGLYHEKGMKAWEEFNDKDSAVINRFIAFSEWLPSNVFFGWLRNTVGRRMSTNELFEFLDCQPVFNNEDSSTSKSFVKEQDFVKYRYFEQQKYFSNTSGKYKKTYYLLQKWILALSLSVSICSLIFIFLGNYCWSGKDDVIPGWFGNLDNLIVAIVSAIAAYLSSNEKLCRNLEFWLKFRTTSERLKTEYSLYQGRCGIYNIEDDKPDENGNFRATKRFRTKVEEIVQKANDSFERIIQGDSTSFAGNKDDKHDDGGNDEHKENDNKKGKDGTNEDGGKKGDDPGKDVKGVADQYLDTLLKGSSDSLDSAMKAIQEEKDRRAEEERKRQEEAERKKKEEEERKKAEAEKNNEKTTPGASD